MTGEQLLTVREVATQLKVGEETVRRWIRSKRLRAVMPGGEKSGYRIPASEVQRLIRPENGTGEG